MFIIVSIIVFIIVSIIVFIIVNIIFFIMVFKQRKNALTKYKLRYKKHGFSQFSWYYKLYQKNDIEINRNL